MKRRTLITVVVVILALVLSGCGAATSPAVEKAAGKVADYAVSSDRFQVKLPPLYVQYHNDGVLGVAGFTTIQLRDWTGIDLTGLNLQPYVVTWLVNANVQHIEIAEGAEGFALYVNGKPLPYIAWDAKSLDKAGDLLPAFGVPYGKVIDAVLPILTRLQLALVIQFPIQQGVAVAPFRDRSAPVVVPARRLAVPEPAAVVRFDIAYDEEGMPSFLGLDAATLRSLGIDLRPFQLSPALVASLTRANIQHVQFVNRSDGVHIYVNNEPLPYLAWDDRHIQNAVDLYARLYGQTGSPVLALFDQVLPVFRAADVDLALRFPTPEGVEPIPLSETPGGQ